MAVRSQKAGAPEAWNGDRVESTVVCFCIEQGTRRNEIPRSRRQARDVEFRVGGAIDMARAATDPRLPRLATKKRRRIES
jgi:hypothetical protein